MRTKGLFLLAAASALVLAACGGSSPSSTPTTSAVQLSNASWEKAGPTPSASAKMICQKEAREEIAASLSVTETRVTTPTWVDHTYACTYVYPKGRITLSVKEFVGEQGTTAYFDGLIHKYGTTDSLKGLGQGAWELKNDDVVVRKDYKVLFVDVSGVPAGNGAFVPVMQRSDVAVNIATTIMGCWTGA